MREHEHESEVPKEKKDQSAAGGLTALIRSCATLADVYTKYCVQIKLTPDPSVARLLEVPTAEVTSLDFSTLILTPANFDVVMEVCRLLPTLRSLNLSNTALRPECITSLVEMATEHGNINSINLSENKGLGFAAAKLLLPMIKAQKSFVELNVDGTAMAAPTKELISKVLDGNIRRMELEPQSAGSPTGSPMSNKGSPTSTKGASPRLANDMVLKDFDSTMNSTMPGEPGASPSKASAAEEMINLDNNRLLDQLMEHEERSVDFIKSLKDQLKQDTRKMGEIGERTVNYLDEFKEGYKWPSPSAFNFEAAVEKFDCNIDPDDLADIYKEYSPLQGPTYVNIKTLLNELLDSSTTRRRKQAIQTDLADKVKKHGPGMPEMCKLVGVFTELMGQDGNAMNELKQLLEDTDEQMQEAKVKIDRFQVDRARLIQEEDLRSAEGVFESMLEVQEQQIDLVLYRLGQLMDRGSKQQLIENLKKHSDNANAITQETSTANADIANRIDEDVETYKQSIVDEQAAMKKREEEYADQQRVTEARLVDNVKQQDRIWINIEKQLEQLEELNAERTKEVTSLLGKVQEQDRQRVESEALIKVCEEQIKILEELRHDNNTCEQITKSFGEWYDSAVKTTKALADSTSSEGDHLAYEERKSYLAVFKQYYVSMGELLFKKSKRLEEVDRMIRNCEFQIEFCKETLDPDLPRYKNQLKDFNTRRVDIASKVDALQKRGDERAKVFMPHEQELRKAGVEFDSPLLLMHEYVVESRSRVLVQRQKFIKRDKDELIDKEALQIDEMAANTKTARDAGNTHMIKPLCSSPLKAPQPPAKAGKANAAPRSGAAAGDK